MKICSNKQNKCVADKNSVVTIGNFDGLHKGHLKLIEKVVSLKNKYKLKSVVMTFDVNTKLNSNLIFEKGKLENKIKDFQIDCIFYLDFLNEVKDMSCEDFVKIYLCDILKTKYVVVGGDFLFGKNKSGNVETLKTLGEKYDIKTVVVPFYVYRGEIMSSTYIRTLLSEGKVWQANKFMHSPFSVRGIVKKGYNLGSSILNIPTANISVPNGMVKLKDGVYATEVIVDNIRYKGVTNVGVAPIKPKKNPLYETFILDFDKKIYRKKIEIIFIKYMRRERKFKDFDALKKQIAYDIKYREGL